jgi:hypothetical protein
VDPVVVLLRDRDSRKLVLSLTGTDDPGVVTGAVVDAVGTALRTPVDRIESVTASVGLAACVVLDDGRLVLFKRLPAAEEKPRIDAVDQALVRLADAGFPCPRPLADPVRCLGGWAVVHQWRTDGQPADSHDPSVRRVQAGALARLHRLTSAWEPDLRLGTKELPEGTLWVRPHNDLFDFEATGAGAETIDQRARQARLTLDRWTPRTRLISHTDWSAQHLRFGPDPVADGVAMVYDWDSLRLVDEAYTVGLAAATFTARWDPGIDPWPSEAESEAFIADYQQARGQPFDSEERRVIAAYTTYTTAYKDRCVHALATR